jgi:2-amino-4-hydroxy-6-hydroxymethyldihydropteridine diphosphokinase
MAEIAYIGVGSNLGDRLGYLEAGLGELAAVPGVAIESVSSVYETAPQGYVDQPSFLNAVFSLRANLSPQDLLATMQGIEDRHHRQRRIHWGPRTLDLDLLLFGDRQWCTAELVLPHPHMADRCFVLVPLCEIAPDLRHPLTGRPFRGYAQSLDCACQVRCLGALLVLTT